MLSGSLHISAESVRKGGGEMEGVMEGGRGRTSREGKCISYPILVFEICKGGYMLLIQIKWGAGGEGSIRHHACEGQWGLFSTNLPVFLAALERLIERGKEGRWERERDRLGDSEARCSLDPADYS